MSSSAFTPTVVQASTPDASASQTGLVNITTQTFAGVKTFQNSTQFSSGSAGTPGLTFSLDPDTGIYTSGANTLDFATFGTNKGKIDQTGQWTIGTPTGSPQEHTFESADFLNVILSARNSGHSNLVFRTNNTQTGRIQVTSSGTWTFSNAASDAVMSLASTGRCTIGHPTNTVTSHVMQGKPTSDAVLRLQGTAAGSGTYQVWDNVGVGGLAMGFDAGSTIFKFRANSVSSTVLGELTTAGAWTLGTASTTLTHTMNVGAASRAIKFGPGSGNIRPGLTVDNAGNSIAVAMATGAGNPQLNFAGGPLIFNNGTYATISDATDMGTGGAGTTVGQVSTAGVWTFGSGTSTSDVTHTFKGTTGSGRHTILTVEGSIGADSLSVSAVGTNTDQYAALIHDRNNVRSYLWSIAANPFKFITSTNDTWASPISGMAGYTEVGSYTGAGSWTLGVPGGTLSQTVNGIFQVRGTNTSAPQVGVPQLGATSYAAVTITNGAGTQTITPGGIYGGGLFIIKGLDSSNTGHRWIDLVHCGDSGTWTGGFTVLSSKTLNSPISSRAYSFSGNTIQITPSGGTAGNYDVAVAQIF